MLKRLPTSISRQGQVFPYRKLRYNARKKHYRISFNTMQESEVARSASVRKLPRDSVVSIANQLSHIVINLCDKLVMPVHPVFQDLGPYLLNDHRFPRGSVRAVSKCVLAAREAVRTKKS
jgi:hypothetical protein